MQSQRSSWSDIQMFSLHMTDQSVSCNMLLLAVEQIIKYTYNCLQNTGYEDLVSKTSAGARCYLIWLTSLHWAPADTNISSSSSLSLFIICILKVCVTSFQMNQPVAWTRPELRQVAHLSGFPTFILKPLSYILNIWFLILLMTEMTILCQNIWQCKPQTGKYSAQPQTGVTFDLQLWAASVASCCERYD